VTESRLCLLVGCDRPIQRKNKKWCSPSHRTKGWTIKKAQERAIRRARRSRPPIPPHLTAVGRLSDFLWHFDAWFLSSREMDITNEAWKFLTAHAHHTRIYLDKRKRLNVYIMGVPIEAAAKALNPKG